MVSFRFVEASSDSALSIMSLIFVGRISKEAKLIEARNLSPRHKESR